MHNPTNMAISFVLLIAVVGAAFSYVSGNPVEFVEPWLGIKGTIIDADLVDQLDLAQNEGFVITCVEQNSPAQNKGLRARDIITEVDSIKVISLNDIAGVLEQKQVGDSVRFTIVRGTEQPTTEELTFVDKLDTTTCPP
ncbi:MAG TPA: PDZ domain-containing protein [Nitrososphaera sp.]|jgi:S1-C subfamily serine protease